MALYKIEQFIGKDWNEWPVEENERFDVILRTGERFVTDTAKMEVSSTLWKLYSNFKRLKAKPEHFFHTIPISNKNIDDILSTIITDIYDEYKVDEFCKEELWKILDEISTDIYAVAVVDYSAYVRGYGTIEFNELYQHPKFKEIRESIKPTPSGIMAAQKALIKVIRTEASIRYHPIIMDLNSGCIKMEQFLQIILVRGFNTDVDSHIYKYPILGNYFKGITDPAEVMMESTLAAKALIFQDAPLKQTEYANRRIQLSAGHVDLLIAGDCGAKPSNEVLVTRERFDGLLGFYYQDGNQERPLRQRHVDKIGQTLTFRMPHSCRFRDKQSICEACYGELSHSIPYGSNLGVIGSANTISTVSQSVLKVKHSEDSTDIEDIVLTEAEKDFIRLGEEGEGIYVTEDVIRKKVRLVLNARARNKEINASMIPIITLESIKGEGNVSKLTQFDTVTFAVDNEDPTKKPMQYHVTVSRGVRKSFLTAKFLRYILMGGFRVEDDGKYYIELDKWNPNDPVFELPRQHLNMRDFASEVVTFVQSSKSNVSSRHLGTLPQLNQYNDPTEGLMDLYDLVKTKVDTHTAHLSVVMLSMMINRDDTLDYHTPPVGVPVTFAKYEELMNRRSIGGLFAFKGGARQMNSNIEQYLSTDRPPHFLDAALVK